MITVEVVPQVTLNAPVARKRKKKTLNKYDKAAVKRYKDAYKAVYGVRPEIKRDGKWFRVKGQSAGVTRQRLVEMAKKLEYRAGE